MTSPSSPAPTPARGSDRQPPRRPPARRKAKSGPVATAVNLAPVEAPTLPDNLPAPPDVLTEGEVASRPKGKRQGATRIYLFKGGICDEDVALETVPGLTRADSNLVWIDLSEYAEPDLRLVADLLGLHPLTVEASLGDWERPRVDMFPDYFFMSVTVVRADQGKRKLVAGELNIAVGHNFLVTAHKLPLKFGEKILERLKQSPEIATMHTAFALYIILEELVEYYEGLFEFIDEEIEQAEERALTESTDKFLSDLLALKRYIFVLGRFAEQHRSVFAVLTRPDFTHVSGENVEPYFRDLQENLARLIDKLVAARESVTEAFDIYVSQVSHRTNQLIRILTLISTVVLPATLVVGFFSTNFTDIKVLQSFPAFIIMLAIMVLLPVATIVFIRRRHLI